MLVAMMEVPALAGNVTLGWNSNTNPVVAGYDVYFWIQGDVSTNKITVGDDTSVTLSNLVTGTTYLFAAATYDSSGLESPLSDGVSYTVPANVLNQLPTLNPISNLTVNQIADGNRLPNGGAQKVVLTGIAPSNAANSQQTITITATSSNPALVPNPVINYTSPNTNGTLTFTPKVNVNGTATITVVVNDGGRSNNLFSCTFTIVVLPPGTIWPSFTSQLTNKLVVAGQSVNLGITAAGTGPLKYQWTLNGVNLVSKTNATLTLNNVTTNQSGSYSVMVSNIAGSTNSNPATLTVYATAAANLTPTVHASGQFGLTVAGVPGYPYVVQASTDLVNWVSLQTNTAPFTFVDANAGQFSRRFYRSIYNP